MKKFDCYPDGWNPDRVLKMLEEYSVFSIPIFVLVIMKIICYQLPLWYKYSFESELHLERVPKFSGWITLWISILYIATNFIEHTKFQIFIKKPIWSLWRLWLVLIFTGRASMSNMIAISFWVLINRLIFILALNYYKWNVSSGKFIYINPTHTIFLYFTSFICVALFLIHF